MGLATKNLLISDLHSGENRTTAKHLYESICRYLTPDLFDLTHLYVCGDFTHKQLSASSEDYRYTKMTFLYIVNFCTKHDIIIRWLEGTPSHDYQQVDILSLSVSEECNFKYYKDIAIEYDEEYEIYTLYIPDEMGTHTGEILSKVKHLMNELGITTVHRAIMHGSFTYHMFGRLSYEISDFDFVTEFIAIGHNHNKSVVGNIITPSSFERNSFGETAPKGGFVVTTSSFSSNIGIKFRENMNSIKYDTIDILGCDNEYGAKILIKKLNTYDSKYLRVNIVGNKIIDYQLLKNIAKEYGVILEQKSPSKVKKDDEQLVYDNVYEDIHITPSNIESEIIKQLKEDGTFDNDCVSLIHEII